MENFLEDGARVELEVPVYIPKSSDIDAGYQHHIELYGDEYLLFHVKNKRAKKLRYEWDYEQ